MPDGRLASCHTAASKHPGGQKILWTRRGESMEADRMVEFTCRAGMRCAQSGTNAGVGSEAGRVLLECGEKEPKVGEGCLHMGFAVRPLWL